MFTYGDQALEQGSLDLVQIITEEIHKILLYELLANIFSKYIFANKGFQKE